MVSITTLTQSLLKGTLEGVSITHGAPGSHTHIWSFVAAVGDGAYCPCSNDLMAILYALHQLKLVTTISMTDLTVIGLEKAAQTIFHAAHSITSHTLVYNFHLPLPITLSYKFSAKTMN